VIEFDKKRENFHPLSQNVTEELTGHQGDYIVRNFDPVFWELTRLACIDECDGYIDAALNASGTTLTFVPDCHISTTDSSRWSPRFV
jgi:hypothetical protein